MELLQKNDEMTAKELSDELGISRESISNSLKRMRRDVKKIKKGRVYYYSLL